MKELNTKMKKEWRNVKKRGMEQSNRGRKQRPKRGNVGDAHGKERLRMLYKTLPFTATLLKIKICPTLQKMLGCFKPPIVVSVSLNNAN